MINKDICKKCWESNGITTHRFDDNWSGTAVEGITRIAAGWSGVYCPSSIGERAIEGEPPPPKCPHKLEHAMLAGMSNAK